AGPPPARRAPAGEAEEGFGEAHAEPGPAELAADARVQLAEFAEDLIELVGGNADAGVGHAVHDLVALEAGADGHAPLLRELERVSHQIGQALGDALAVPAGPRQVRGP